MKLPRLAWPQRRASRPGRPKATHYQEAHFQRLARHGLRPALIWKSLLGAVILYYLLVGATAFSIYKKDQDTPWNRAMTRVFPYPAAVVNHQVISLQRVWFQTDALQTHNAKHGVSSTPAQTQSFVLSQASNHVLYEQALASHNLRVTPADVQQQMLSIYKDVGGQDKLASFLTSEYGPGMTVQHFQDWIVAESLSQAAVEQQLLVRVTVSHILIAVPSGASDAQVSAAQKRAAEVKGKISSPDQFAGIAKQYSEDVASRDNGGQLGTTNRGADVAKYGQSFDDAIFALQPNVVSDPIRSTYGWEIVLVTKREGVVDESLEQYTDQLRSQAHIRSFVK